MDVLDQNFQLISILVILARAVGTTCSAFVLRDLRKVQHSHFASEVKNDEITFLYLIINLEIFLNFFKTFIG